jgi:hypothetical protein
MRTSLCLLLLVVGALPLAAQPDRRMFPARDFPPEIMSQDLPRDIIRAAPPHRVLVDFENDQTRVLRFALFGGERIPTHDDREGVLVCLKECRIRFTMPDGSMLDVELKAGGTRWMPEGRRAIRNLAVGLVPGRVELLYIESKRPPA